VTCLLNNKLVRTICLTILPRGKISCGLLSDNIAPIFITRNLKVCARHTGFKNILVWKHLVSFMNTWSLALMLWPIHKFDQRLMTVVEIGIVTLRLRLEVWKVACRVLKLLLAWQYWRIVWIIWKRKCFVSTASVFLSVFF